MPQRHDDLEMSMRLLQSVAVLDVPIDNKMLILFEKKKYGKYGLVKA
jgi:hypothetical protein